MSWRRKRSKGTYTNPVIGASVINKGGGGGDKPMRKKTVDAKANRELSASPKTSRGWETVRWQDMSPGQREEMTGSITEGNVFVPASKRPRADRTMLDMSDLDRERDAIMAGTKVEKTSHSRTLKGFGKDWRAIGLAAAAQNRMNKETNQ